MPSLSATDQYRAIKFRTPLGVRFSRLKIKNEEWTIETNEFTAETNWGICDCTKINALAL